MAISYSSRPCLQGTLSPTRIWRIKGGASAAALPEPRPFQSEQFELTVPEGYVGGEDLPVALPDGRQVIVAIPDGLGEGDDGRVYLLWTESARRGDSY